MTLQTTLRVFPFGTQNGIDVDPTLRELRETEPVCRVRMASGGQAWLVTRHEDIRAVESDPRFSKDHNGVLRLLSAAFTPRRVAELRPRIQQIVDELLDDMVCAGPPFDLFDGFAYALPLAVMGELLTDELLADTELLILIGQDTTANLIANSVVTLFRHPYQLELLRLAPELIPNAVEELLRFIPTTIGSPTRVANEDIELGGVTIRAGDAVITIAQAANRDPGVFSNPDRLDVTRMIKPGQVALGHGMDFCLGAALTRMEMAVALGTLLRRFPTLHLAVPDEDLRWVPNQIHYRLEELPVSW